jgi:hypothetical protein
MKRSWHTPFRLHIYETILDHSAPAELTQTTGTMKPTHRIMTEKKLIIALNN